VAPMPQRWALQGTDIHLAARDTARDKLISDRYTWIIVATRERWSLLQYSIINVLEEYRNRRGVDDAGYTEV
jgi:hypothetical protein